MHPDDETITVLTLHDGVYQEHGIFRRRDQAISALLDGFAVDVASVFDAR